MKYGIFKHDENDTPKLVSLMEFNALKEAEVECDRINFRWQTCAFYIGGIGENKEYIKLNQI